MEAVKTPEARGSGNVIFTRNALNFSQSFTVSFLKESSRPPSARKLYLKSSL